MKAFPRLGPCIAVPILAALLASVAPAQKAAGTLITGGTVHLGNGKVIEDALILIQDGKIARVDVGEMESSAEGWKGQRIDAQGKHVYPGLIDLNSRLLLDPGAAAGAAALTSDVIDAIDLFQARVVEEALAQGVTAVYLLPGNSGPLGGTGALLKLKPGASLEDLIVARRVGIELRLGSESARPSARLGGFKGLQDQFKAAEKYVESWDDYAEKLEEYTKELEKLRKEEEKGEGKKEEGKDEAKEEPAKEGEAGKEGSEGGEGSGERPRPGPRRRGPPRATDAEDAAALAELEELFSVIFAPQQRRPPRGRPPRPGGEEAAAEGEKKEEDKGPQKPKRPARDPNKEVLREVLEGKLAVHARVFHAADILNLLDLQKERRFRLVLFTDGEPDRVAWTLGGAEIPVVLTGDPRSFAEEPGVVRRLHGHGVTVAVATPGRLAGETRNLGLCAAAALGGLGEEPALRAVTARPAEILGVSERLGTIAPGRDADLVIADGPPLATGTRVETVLVDGDVVYQR